MEQIERHEEGPPTAVEQVEEVRATLPIETHELTVEHGAVPMQVRPIAAHNPGQAL
jgi:hypothetical protein